MENDMDENTEKQEKWKVTFEGNFWGSTVGRGRGGKEVPVGKTFLWGKEVWHVPSVYRCKEGLVVDFLTEIDADAVTRFIAQNAVTEELVEELTEEEREMLENKNPLNVEFQPEIKVNGKKLENVRGCGTAWIPQTCFPEAAETAGKTAAAGMDSGPSFQL